MTLLIQAFDAAYNRDPQSLRSKCDSLEAAYYGFEPFLDDAQRHSTWNQLQQFIAMCTDLLQRPDREQETQSKYIKSFSWYKGYFRDQLYSALFR